MSILKLRGTQYVGHETGNIYLRRLPKAMSQFFDLYCQLISCWFVYIGSNLPLIYICGFNFSFSLFHNLVTTFLSNIWGQSNKNVYLRAKSHDRMLKTWKYFLRIFWTLCPKGYTELKRLSGLIGALATTWADLGSWTELNLPPHTPTRSFSSHDFCQSICCYSIP